MALYPNITPERVREIYAEASLDPISAKDVDAIVRDANKYAAEGTSWTADPEKIVAMWVSQELHERDAEARASRAEHEAMYGMDLTFDAGTDYLPFRG